MLGIILKINICDTPHNCIPLRQQKEERKRSHSLTSSKKQEFEKSLTV